jgi:ADP-ribosyl-[dinitrogen reductase] hydrolase
MSGLDQFRGCLFGLAVGDAIGTTLEFKPKGSFQSMAISMPASPMPGQQVMAA